jgi:DNA-binding IclR family transcriptional regulator
MRSPAEPRAGAPTAPNWREEIFQLLFWMQGEGFGDHLDADLLERALGTETSCGVRRLEHLVDEGLLWRDEGGHYKLTAAGRWYGQRVISGEADV